MDIERCLDMIHSILEQRLQPEPDEDEEDEEDKEDE